jgi:hypothetical protein
LGHAELEADRTTLPPLSEFASRQCQLFNYCINPAGCSCGKCEEDKAAADCDWKLPLAQARWQMLEEFRQELLAGARTG